MVSQVVDAKEATEFKKIYNQYLDKTGEIMKKNSISSCRCIQWCTR